MEKNKLYIFIVLLIVVLIFGVSATCAECENKKIPSSSDNPVSQDTTATTKSDPNLIHGVLPTKVTGHATDNKTKDKGSLEFYNVGRLGGEDYSKATYIISRAGKTIKTYEGYFAGGPNGEMHLSSSDGKEIHGQLEGGIEFVSDDGSVIEIDNPDAFDGWTDNTAEDVTTESTEPDETSSETEATSTETDSNLIHGVLPAKVTAHSHFQSSDADSYADTYIEFWNVGELGGEQYSKATGNWVAIRDGKKFSEIIFEGYFTGGPNGDIDMSAVSSSGNDAGSTAKVKIKLKDGEQMLAEDGRVFLIDNPEAFKGWKD